jgi:hypothetical protein
MKSVIVRLVLIVAGFALAWCAMLVSNDLIASTAANSWTRLALDIVTMFAVAAGTLLCVYLVKAAADGDSLDFPDAIVCAGLCAIYFAFTFGVVVAPFGSIASSSAWATPWDFFLIAGFAPLLIAAWNVLVDIGTRVARGSGADGGEKGWTRAPVPPTLSKRP